MHPPEFLIFNYFSRKPISGLFTTLRQYALHDFTTVHFQSCPRAIVPSPHRPIAPSPLRLIAYSFPRVVVQSSSRLFAPSPLRSLIPSKSCAVVQVSTTYLSWISTTDIAGILASTNPLFSFAPVKSAIETSSFLPKSL